MKSVAAALLHLLQLLRPRLLIIIAVALPGEIPPLQKIGFAEALDSIVATDNRYSREAYVFLRDALDYTTKQQKKTKSAAGQTAKAGFTSATCRKRMVCDAGIDQRLVAAATALTERKSEGILGLVIFNFYSLICAFRGRD